MFLTVQIIKVLGEGGFSFVYLAQDEHSGVRSDTVFYEGWHIEIRYFCGLATICIEENTVSNGSTRSERSYERSGGVSPIQVSYSRLGHDLYCWYQPLRPSDILTLSEYWYASVSRE